MCKIYEYSAQNWYVTILKVTVSKQSVNLSVFLKLHCFVNLALQTKWPKTQIDGILPKGPTRHAYAWQIGPFWQDTLEM